MRNARAKEIVAAGDRELAAEVRKLPKPTVAAWLVNALVRTRGRDVEKLIALGPELREAQRNRARPDMRRLADRRRDAIRDLVGAASQQAIEAGHSMASQVQRQVEETLEATVADEESAAAVRAGRLSNPLAFIGFGGDGTSTPRPPTEVRGARSVQAGEGGGKVRREGARKVQGARSVQGAGKVQGAGRRATPADTPRGSASEEKRRPAPGSARDCGRDVGTEKRRRADERALTEAARTLARAQRAMESATVSVQDARRRHAEVSARHRAATKELRDAERDKSRSDGELEKALGARQEAEQRLRQAELEHTRRQTDLSAASTTL